MRTARAAAVATVLGLALLVGGCGSDSSPTASGPSPSFAHAAAKQLSLTDGWASSPAGSDMSSMPGMDMSAESAAYATITNDGTTADALVGVSTPAASSATLHNTVTKKSAGTMVSVRSIPIPAGGHVTLQPGGYHVMLMGLKGDFKVGSTITMTWTFESGARLTTTFPVIDATDRPTTDDK